MDKEITEAIMICAVLALVGWAFYLFFRRYQIATQLQLQRIESFNRLIEKFGNAKEFVEFIQSEQGKKLLEAPVSLRPNPLNKVLRFLQAGVLFIMIGAGYDLNGMRLSASTDPNFIYQRMDSLYWGSLSLFLGLGLVIVAGVTYVFVRRWHLANGEDKR